MKRAALCILLLCAAAAVAGVRWTIAWRVRTGGEILAAPLVTDSTVYCTSQDEYVYALSVKTGKRPWATKLGAPLDTTPVLHGKRLWVATSDNRLVCIEAATGKRLWQHQATDSFGSAPLILPATKTTPARVLASCYDANLYCLSLEGKLLWTATAGDRINGQPALCGETVVFGCCDGKVYFVRLSDGKTLGSVDMEDYLPAGPVVEGTTLYIATAGHTVAKLDATTRKPLWTAKPTKAEEKKLGSLFATPALVGKRLILGDDTGHLRCLSATNGKLLWSVRLRGGIHAPPTLVGIDLLVTTDQGRVYAINPVDGKTLWSYRLGGGKLTSVVPAKDRLLVGSASGWLYCIEPKVAPNPKGPRP
ncbi:MAG: PQQ-binding-like beta-propeller repeat protein [Phycisphaerales bacterium]|jgi:eukaryotic-like serine/threonine-protein kinase|nr:PQQ-binding-like beta-propeller repeat protein [Phycisphaerales bacterium]MBT7170487.1 PQQ-binding-like beta-propeller repeat protein [Phycisphaerales bacterium]